MTFEEYWTEVEKMKATPGMVIKQLTFSLSPETNKRLMRNQAEETAELLLAIIEEVNHESVETIESLIRKKL